MKTYLIFLIAFLCFNTVIAQSPEIIAKKFITETENGTNINKKVAFFKEFNLNRKDVAVAQRAEEFVSIYRILEKLNSDAAFSFAVNMSDDPIAFQQILKTFTKEERIGIKNSAKTYVENYRSGTSIKPSSNNFEKNPVDNTAELISKQFLTETENGTNLEKTAEFYRQYKLNKKGKGGTLGDFSREFVAIYHSLERINPAAAVSFANCMSAESETNQYFIMETFTEKERNYLKGKSKLIASQKFTIKPELSWTIYKFYNSHWRARVPKNTKAVSGSKKMYMPKVSVNNKVMPQLDEYVDYIKATDQTTGNIFCVVKTYIDDAKDEKSMQIGGENFLYGIALAVHSLYPNNMFSDAVKNTNSIYKLSAEIKNNVDGMGSLIVMEDDSGNSIVTNLFHHYGTNELLVHFIKFNKKVTKRSDVSDQEWQFLHQYEYSETK